jgi:hypothetical protein
MNFRSEKYSRLLSAAAGLLFLAASGGALQAQTSGCQARCASQLNGTCWELKRENPRAYESCVALCQKRCEATPPSVVLRPKYLVLAILYAPPGCTPSAEYPCQPSTATYAEASKLGTKVSTSHSFKYGTEAKGGVDIGFLQLGADTGFSETWSHESSVDYTKTGNKTFTAVSGKTDSIDHGWDAFLLELNPTVTLVKKNYLYWYPGISGSPVEPTYVYASELENPATMRQNVATNLKEAGLTTQDYACILALDPFGGPSRAGPLGQAVYCNGPENASGTTPTGVTLDPHRFWLTTGSLPYEPPYKGVCGIQSSFTLANDFISESSHAYERDTTVGFTVGAGNLGPAKKDIWGLQDETDLTWTYSKTGSSSAEDSQSASAAIQCSSPGDNDPRTDVQIYWDSLYSTFLFKLVDPATMQTVQQGKVVNGSGKPMAGQAVDLTYGGKTYHTLTGPSGTYRFLAPRTQPRPSGTAIVVVHKARQTVPVGSQGLAVIKIGTP